MQFLLNLHYYYKSEYGVNTNLVRGGIKRSQFKETSEAIFFNSGVCV